MLTNNNNKAMAELNHIPVLLKEVLRVLSPKDGGVYVDATFGGGGYTRAILDKVECRVVGIDRDPQAVERAKKLQTEYPGRFFYAHAKFSEFPRVLDDLGIGKSDGVVFDLGVSSYQIDDPERGFSFRFDAPLSMVMGCSDLSAYDVVNGFSEKELAAIFKQGEEPFARRIAKKIVAKRAGESIKTTGQLASLIASCKPPLSKDVQHPATLAFQALRIFVNEELIELEKGLQLCKNRLREDGRLIVVTFHSLEDRIVKDFMRKESGSSPLPSRHIPLVRQEDMSNRPAFNLIQKKAISPTEQEMKDNPRSRSARLRCAIRSLDQDLDKHQYQGQDQERD